MSAGAEALRSRDGLGDAPSGKTAAGESHKLVHSFADIRFEIQDLIAEDDEVVVRCQCSGRQVGPFAGMPVSGRGFSVQHIHVRRMADGRIMEPWATRDDARAMAAARLAGDGLATEGGVIV